MSQQEIAKIYKAITRQEKKYEKAKGIITKERIMKKTLSLEKRFNFLMGKEQRKDADSASS